MVTFPRGHEAFSAARARAATAVARAGRVAKGSSLLAVVALCASAGALTTLVAAPRPQADDRATVSVWPYAAATLASAELRPVWGTPPSGVEFLRASAPLGAAHITATGETGRDARDRATRAATRYIDQLVAAQNRRLSASDVASSARIRRARRVLQSLPERYVVDVQQIRATTDRAAPLRGALLGAAVGGFLVAVSRSTRKRRTPRIGRHHWALATLCGAAATSIVALSSSLPAQFFAGVLLAVCAGSSFFAVLTHPATAIRCIVLLVVALSPIRSVLIGAADTLSLPYATLLTSALQPTLIFGAAAAAVIRADVLPWRRARVLLLIWASSALVLLANLPIQEVGAGLYAAGVAQYLTYPTLAILGALVFRLSDLPLAIKSAVMIAVGVSASILAQAFGMIDFPQAAAAVVPTLTIPRYGGSTGSYLHASILLGTLITIVTAWSARLPLRSTPIGPLAVTLTLGGLALTFSRGGFAIAALGLLLLIAVATPPMRIRLAGVLVLAAVLSVPVALAGGLSPVDLTGKLTSSVDVGGEPGNQLRFAAMRESLDRFQEAPLRTQLLGEGPAATGNTRKLLSLPATSTESLPLKYLVELGIVGVLVFGGIWLWVIYFHFTRMLTRRATLSQQALGAGAIALSIYGILFPILEPQVLSVLWWLLLSVSLVMACGASDAVGYAAGEFRARSSSQADRQSGPAPKIVDSIAN